MRLYFKEDKKKYIETEDIRFLSKLKIYIVWSIMVNVASWILLLIIGLLLGF